MTDMKITDFLDVLPSSPETDKSCMQVGRLLMFLSYQYQRYGHEFKFSIKDGSYFAWTSVSQETKEFDTIGESLSSILKDIVTEWIK